MAGAIGIIGTAVQAVGQIASANAAAAAHEQTVAANKRIAARNAANLEEAAERDRKLAIVQTAAARRKNRAEVSATLHAGAADGGALTGSPLLILANNAAELELEALMISYKGELAAREKEDEAIMQRYRADNQAPGPSRAAGLLGATGTMLQGGAQYYEATGGAGLVDPATTTGAGGFDWNEAPF